MYRYNTIQWYWRRSDKLSAAAAARRSTKVGGSAHKLSTAAAVRPAHGSNLASITVAPYTKGSRFVVLNEAESCERQPVLWAAFLGLAGSLRICGMSFTGSPTLSALSTTSLRWFDVAWKVWQHFISGNSVAPLLLLSVVSHCALLRRRSY